MGDSALGSGGFNVPSPANPNNGPRELRTLRRNPYEGLYTIGSRQSWLAHQEEKYGTFEARVFHSTRAS